MKPWRYRNNTLMSGRRSMLVGRHLVCFCTGLRDTPVSKIQTTSCWEQATSHTLVPDWQGRCVALSSMPPCGLACHNGFGTSSWTKTCFRPYTSCKRKAGQLQRVVRRSRNKVLRLHWCTEQMLDHRCVRQYVQRTGYTRRSGSFRNGDI